jgi:hypothetical protein
MMDPEVGVSSQPLARGHAPVIPAPNWATRIYSTCPAAASATGIALRMNAPNIGTVNAVSP